MPRLISRPSSTDSEIVSVGDKLASDCYLRIATLDENQSIDVALREFETICVVLSGRVNVQVGEDTFQNVGKRADIWSGAADSVYLGTEQTAVITAVKPGTEIAIIGGRCGSSFTPFRVLPSEVETVEVGSVETHSRRCISHILGQNGRGRAGNLLVSELYADPGCWSGYPPHKHDEERPPEETQFQELYHYRFNPPTGFGGQYHYHQGQPPSCSMTQDGDTFIVEDGYHPTSTSPGHRGYILTTLVGKHQRSLVQHFDPNHAHLMDKIPGISDMRSKFK